MDVVVEGDGPVAARARAWLGRDDGPAATGGRRVVVLATPQGTWPDHAATVDAGEAVTVAPGIGAIAHDVVDVADAGWFGGIGVLLGAVAVDRATDPAALHVAYGTLPRPTTGWRAVGPSARLAALDALAGGGTARVEGEVNDEPLAVGRRLAWFPSPVGPAHAAAVPGAEAAVVAEPLASIPTVRTWVAAGSVRSELLQALGRHSGPGRVGDALRRQAARPRRAEGERTRWAVVAEVRDGDGDVVRAWANGVDPVGVTGTLLAVAARAAATTDVRPRSVVELAPTGALLDQLADAGVLRWSVARPTPSRH